MNKLYNEVYNQVNGVSNYKGKIKGIINDCIAKMEQCKDIYNENAIWKYQSEILNKALMDIGNVMQQGYQIFGNELEKAINKLPAENPNPTYTVHDMVKMQRLQMQLNCMNDTQVEQVLQSNISDSFIVDICKNEMMNRAKQMDDKEQSALRQAEIRNIQPVTREVILNQCNVMYKELGADVNNSALLWGMSVGERVAIDNAGGIRQFILSKANVVEPLESDMYGSRQFK